MSGVPTPHTADSSSHNWPVLLRQSVFIGQGRDLRPSQGVSVAPLNQAFRIQFAKGTACQIGGLGLSFVGSIRVSGRAFGIARYTCA